MKIKYLVQGALRRLKQQYANGRSHHLESCICVMYAYGPRDPIVPLWKHPAVLAWAEFAGESDWWESCPGGTAITQEDYNVRADKLEQWA